jgi:DNA-binding NtrC family response regulator
MSTNKHRRHQLLAVDDNPNALEIIKRTLAGVGYQVITCDSVQTAVDLLDQHAFDVVITDFKMPSHSGLDLVRYVSDNFSDIGTIMITGYPSIEGAVEAIKTGAQEFLAKPFTDAELLAVVRKVLSRPVARQHGRENIEPGMLGGIVGRSNAMQRVFKLIAKAAALTANVLISGESGTGKELVARAIHYGSTRSSAAFVPVNCTAIPESLIESELFGHEKGAFTGAHSARDGFFQVAGGGTVFLDEIGDASQRLQAKLLRVIQNKEIVKVGSSRVIKVDARIVAATNKNLADLVASNRFREDLYYRINVIDIAIPPLRERSDDVLLLIQHVLDNLLGEHGGRPLSFSDRALQAMTDYAWPGNVRELENLIQKLAVTVDHDLVDVADLPEPMRFSINRESGLNRSLAEVEVDHITRVMAHVGGNKSRAAQILKIDRKTLRQKLRKMSPDP